MCRESSSGAHHHPAEDMETEKHSFSRGDVGPHELRSRSPEADVRAASVIMAERRFPRISLFTSRKRDRPLVPNVRHIDIPARVHGNIPRIAEPEVMAA